MKFRLSGMAACICGVAAIALTPMGVGAQSVGVDATVFTGNALTSGVDWVLGTGSYSFKTNVCADVEVEPGEVEVQGGVNAPCSGSAAGTFTNVVCGTGLTGNLQPGGAADTVSFTDNTGAADGSISYGIAFVATVGVVVGNGTEPDGGAGPVAGVVQINATPNAPTATPPNFGTCTTTFNVEVAAVAVG